MNILSIINRTSSFTWGVIYLSLIPFFAFVYNTFLPYEFYHSTFQNEAIFESEKNNIKKELEKIVKTNFYIFNNGRESIKIQNYDLDYLHSRLDNIKFIDGISFDMDLTYYKPSAKSNPSNLGTAVFLHLHCSIPEHSLVNFLSGINYENSEDTFQLLVPVDFKKKTANGDYIYIHQVKRAATNNFQETFLRTNPDLKKIYFNVSPDDNSGINILSELQYPYFHNDFIFVSKDLIERIYAYGKGLRGLPAEVNGNYWRMFYFSSATITTVGFGDIVPITTRARLLVTTEAILGVVIIGLFLNSLANSIKRG